jgi:DNA-binding response OmpR family regulator
MKNILLVEDDPNTARAVALRLEAQGQTIQTANNVESALLLARAGDYDLFILDIGLPDFDGITLAEQLLHLPRARLTPVLFLTGCRDLSRRLRASSLGAFGWLEKPYQPAALLQAVEMALSQDDPGAGRGNPFSPLHPWLPAPQVRSTVLVIEDDKPIAASIKIRLENAGYEAIVAHNGQAGLLAARDHHPDLILTDIRMPSGLGFTIFEHLKACGAGAVPVIFLTASRKPGLREAAMEMGATAFFEKPFDPCSLLRSIRQALHQRN